MNGMVSINVNNISKITSKNWNIKNKNKIILGYADDDFNS